MPLFPLLWSAFPSLKSDKIFQWNMRAASHPTDRYSSWYIELWGGTIAVSGNVDGHLVLHWVSKETDPAATRRIRFEATPTHAHTRWTMEPESAGRLGEKKITDFRNDKCLSPLWHPNDDDTNWLAAGSARGCINSARVFLWSTKRERKSQERIPEFSTIFFDFPFRLCCGASTITATVAGSNGLGFEKGTLLRPEAPTGSNNLSRQWILCFSISVSVS